MKKIYLLLILIMFLLTGCSLGGLNMRFSTDNKKIANDTFKQIYNIIQHKDKTALKNLFSKSVNEKTSDFDESIANFLDFFQGEVISFDDLEAREVDETIHHGKKRTEIQSIHVVNTSEQKYHIAIKQCTVDDFDSDNVGVTTVYIVNAENWNENTAYRGDWKLTTGIIINKKAE